MPPAAPKVKKAPRPVREAAAAALWASKDAAAWGKALDAAPARAQATGVAGDDAFYNGLDLAGRPGAASAPHPIATLTRDDVVTTVAWKLSRGTWRPRLLGFAEALTAAEVAGAAAKAAAALAGTGAAGTAPPSEAGLTAAIAALSELKGIGPATATALLTAADPAIPFLADEASAVVLGQREYTCPAALALTSALRARAASLGGGGGSRPWSARDVERALWSASRGPEVEGEGGVVAAEGASKKRKRR